MAEDGEKLKRKKESNGVDKDVVHDKEELSRSRMKEKKLVHHDCCHSFKFP